MEKIKKLLIQYGCPKDADVIEETISTNGCTFKKLRDIIVRQGTIIEEIEDNKIYIATIRTGCNYATVAIQLKTNEATVLSYAKEGIIKLNTAQKAIDLLKRSISITTKDVVKVKRKPSMLSRWVLMLTGIIIILLIAVFVSVFSACNAITKYNLAVDAFNVLVDDYNSAVEKTSVDNIEGIPVSVDKLKVENEAIFEGFRVVFGKNSIGKIKADTKTIYMLVDQLENAMKIIEQITVPSGEWVENRIKTVDGITGIQSVTEEKNPDGILNKEGGYSACVYFTVDQIDPETIKGDDIVAKGTDAGGAVEVYSALEDAEARCEYLAEFDGTILYSGSYAIVGTTVIRTSYLLSNEEQFELTDKITQALTKE